MSEAAARSEPEYAIATTDTAFKQMLTIGRQDSSVMLSFLNSFVPNFQHDPAQEVLEEHPVAVPALLKKAVRQTFMDLHVATRSGDYYTLKY